MVNRTPIIDTGVLLVTCGLAMFADFIVAINIGVVSAPLQCLQRMASEL